MVGPGVHIGQELMGGGPVPQPLTSLPGCVDFTPWPRARAWGAQFSASFIPLWGACGELRSSTKGTGLGIVRLLGGISIRIDFRQ